MKLWVAAPAAFCARTVTVAVATSVVVGIETSPEPALIVTPAGAAVERIARSVPSKPAWADTVLTPLPCA